MTSFRNPFSAATRYFKGCFCGRHESPEAHDKALKADAVDDGTSLQAGSEAAYTEMRAEPTDGFERGRAYA
jgi:hypothetical protein